MLMKKYIAALLVTVLFFSVSLEAAYANQGPYTSIHLEGTQGSNGIYYSAVNITLSANGDSNVITQYSLNSGQSWDVYSAPINVSTVKSYSIQYRSIDSSGTEPIKTTKFSIKKDEYAPTTTIELSGDTGETGYYYSEVSVSFSAIDYESGVEYTEYSIDGGATWERYTASFTLQESKNSFVQYRSTDRKGNVEKIKKTKVLIDRIKPGAPDIVLTPSGWSNSVVKAVLSQGNDEESGIKKTVYRLTEEGQWFTYNEAVVLTESSPHIWAKSIDNAGNESEVVTSTAQIDLVSPSIPKMTLSHEGWSNEEVYVTVDSATDTKSGISRYEYKFGENGDWHVYSMSDTFTDEAGNTVVMEPEPIVISENGETIVFARAADAANNKSNVVSKTVRVDTESPIAPTEVTDSQRHYNRVTLSWSGASDNLGIIKYEVYKNGQLFTTTSNTTVQLNNLEPNTEYTFKIIVYDQAGNYAETEEYKVTTGSKPQFYSVADGHSILLKEDGTVWTWGKNSLGQLGDGTRTDRSTPKKIISNIRKIYNNGNSLTLAMNLDGSVWIWGGASNQNSPVIVPEYTDIKEIFFVNNSIYATKNDGTTLGWTLSTYNETYGMNYPRPTEIVQLRNLIDISGEGVAVLADGTLKTWGNNQVCASFSSSSTRFKAGIGRQSSFAVIITNTGYAYAWGDDTNGQLGDGLVLNGMYDTTHRRDCPSNVMNSETSSWLGNISNVYASTDTSFAIDYGHQLWSWGSNSGSLLGRNTTQTSYSAERVAVPGGVSRLIPSGSFILAVTPTGELWGWGKNDYGQLGNGDTSLATIKVPTKVMIPSVIDINMIGTAFSAITEDGSLWRWGGSEKVVIPEKVIFDIEPPSIPTGLEVGTITHNSVSINWNASVDNNSVANYDVYVNDFLVKTVSTLNTSVGGLYPGTSYSICIKAKDAMGNESECSNSVTLTTQGYSGATGTERLITGLNHTAHIDQDGTVWMWGANSQGQAGDGSKTDQTSRSRVPGLTDIVEVSAGNLHTVAVKEDGTVWAWGNNDYYQLGDGTQITRLNPVQVLGLSDVTDVATSWRSNYVLKSDGTVWAWGNGQRTPYQISNLNNVVAIKAGNGFAVVLKVDGTVWAWGNNGSGQLGDGTLTNRAVPVQVNGLDSITDIAVGDSFSLALKSDGTVWGWGASNYGQLGINGSRLLPVKLDSFSQIQSIGAGSNATYAVNSSGTLLAMGLNTSGQLGDGTTSSRITPIQVSGMNGVVEVSGGESFGVASKLDGTIWAWGYNQNGQLGDGTTTNRLTAVRVQENIAPIVTLRSPSGTQAAPMVTGITKPSIYWTQTDASSTMFTQYQVQILDGSGQVVMDSGVMAFNVTAGYGSWTVNTGLPMNQGLQARVRVKDTTVWSEWTNTGWFKIDPDANKDARIAAAESHSAYIKADGTAWAWGGNNSYGPIGDGSSANATTRQQVQGLTDVVSVATGSLHTLAALRDGTVRAWGYNYYGQLGNNTTTNQTTPITVPGLTDVIAVTAAVNASYALKKDGTVWKWGDNQKTPIQVSGIGSVMSIRAGNGFAVALKTDGTVWAWGSTNGNGQLGNGTMTANATPVRVGTLDSIVTIAVGYDHSMALKSDGTVWGWGASGLGQLGSNSDKLAPIQIPNLSQIKAIGAGKWTSYAVKDTGMLWSLGNNDQGQLGNGGTTASLTPVQVTGLSGIEAIVAGNGYAIAIKLDGSLYAWGNNSYGQLGDGTTTNRTTAVQVQ